MTDQPTGKVVSSTWTHCCYNKNMYVWVSCRRLFYHDMHIWHVFMWPTYREDRLINMNPLSPPPLPCSTSSCPSPNRLRFRAFMLRDMMLRASKPSSASRQANPLESNDRTWWGGVAVGVAVIEGGGGEMGRMIWWEVRITAWYRTNEYGVGGEKAIDQWSALTEEMSVDTQM